MSKIRSQIQEKLKEAMKSKDQRALLVYRNLISDFKRYEVDEIKELTDEVAMSIIATNIKQRNQSIDAYTQAGRTDLLGPEVEEKKLLEQFMPAQMSPEAAKQKVQDILSRLDPSKRNMGDAMKACMAELQGSVDSKTISGLVKECLKT